MEKMTTREKIGSILFAIGMVGLIASASALESSALEMALGIVIFGGIAAIAVPMINETAETEAPAANTMERGNDTANS